MVEESILYFILYKFGKKITNWNSNLYRFTKETKKKTVTEVVKEKKCCRLFVDEATGEEKEVKKFFKKMFQKKFLMIYFIISRFWKRWKFS